MDEPACGLTQLNASRGGETLEKRATKSEETHPAVTMLAGGTANTKRARVSQDGCSDARVLAMTGAKSAIAADPKLSAALQKNVGQVCNLSVTWVAKRSEKIGVTSDKMGHERTRDSPAFLGEQKGRYGYAEGCALILAVVATRGLISHNSLCGLGLQR